jgi:hypothetical protein
MVHRIKKISKWNLKTYKDGSMRFTLKDKFIDVHKTMGLYWIDYGLKGGHSIGTLKPVKTLKEAMKQVEESKDEFVLTEKR